MSIQSNIATVTMALATTPVMTEAAAPVERRCCPRPRQVGYRSLFVRIGAIVGTIAVLGCFDAVSCYFSFTGYYNQQLQLLQPKQQRVTMLRQQSTLTSDDETAVIATNSTADDFTSSSSSLMIDIISVGSLTKPTFQDAQLRTFGSHAAVRNFFRITEEDDADQACTTQLTIDQLHDVHAFCDSDDEDNKESLIRKELRKALYQHSNHTGWVCAQKRPIDGLHKVLQQYRDDGTLSIPDYVFILDDDTYVNMDSMLDLLSTNISASAPPPPHVRAGCVLDFFVSTTGFTFPYGGFGSFLSRPAIERLLQPIACGSNNATFDDPLKADADADAFVRLACARLQSNSLGEAPIFVDGMSVSDLMFQFATQHSYGNVGNWTKGAGFCMHSDHALAYFFNYYHIAATDEQLQWLEKDLSNQDALRNVSYKAITSTADVDHDNRRRGECKNIFQACNKNNHVCHYIGPDQMDELYLLQQRVDVTVTSTHVRQGLEDASF